MLTPPIPSNESARLDALHSYGIINSSQEDTYKQITDLACQITNMPVALVSLVDADNVWFKSTTGIDLCNVDREISLCSHVIGADENTLVVNNLKEDSRFYDNPYALLSENPIMFYAGVSLVDQEGFSLGTLCVIDHKPNEITYSQLASLKTLAKQVMKLIELHRSNIELKRAQEHLRIKNGELREFAGRVSHDMKMPLSNIIVTTDLLRAKFRNNMDEEVSDYLSYLKGSSFNLSDYIDGLLAHYQSDDVSESQHEAFDLNHLLEEIVELLNVKHNCEINFPEVNYEIRCNRAALEQILLNLIGNALKYNDKEDAIINIDCDRKNGLFFFKVSDNGVGIPQEKLDDIFELFSTIGNLDREGKRGHGIGLSTVKKLTHRLGGDIKVTSDLGKGSVFEFWIKAKS
ncbi:GAF sensor signal transduction histidine kinase [Flavobacteriaceae bacterium MAR_2010_188]|nr:GAF sensor signal transduction histidine kinase [Flavobacteriaceae bacterium MAR_2010_188]